jgi:hypothetical protein
LACTSRQNCAFCHRFWRGKRQLRQNQRENQRENQDINQEEAREVCVRFALFGSFGAEAKATAKATTTAALCHLIGDIGRSKGTLRLKAQECILPGEYIPVQTREEKTGDAPAPRSGLPPCHLLMHDVVGIKNYSTNKNELPK